MPVYPGAHPQISPTRQAGSELPGKGEKRSPEPDGSHRPRGRIFPAISVASRKLVHRLRRRHARKGPRRHFESRSVSGPNGKLRCRRFGSPVSCNFPEKPDHWLPATASPGSKLKSHHKFAQSDAIAGGSAPRRGVDSPPGQELLGVITSHGPSRESYRPSRKSSGAAEAIGPPAADAALSAERMRAALSSPAGAPALLQRRMPGGGAEMVAVEGAADDTGRRRRANRNGTVKAGATGSASRAGNHQSQRQLTRPRG